MTKGMVDMTTECLQRSIKTLLGSSTHMCIAGD